MRHSSDVICSLLHWYNLYINEGHCWTYNTFVSGEEGHHQMCMWLTTQHMNTLIAWYVSTYTYTPTHADTAMNTYICTDSVDQLCLCNSHTLRNSFLGCLKCSTVSLRKLHRRCFLKRFYPEAKVAVRGNSLSPTSKLASSLTANEVRKTN